MPNTGRGGGVSRKIVSLADRRRLKEILEDLDIPEGMGVIVRTAGAERSKAEIKRDYEYLLRLWNEIRDLTLKSTAPALIYEEGNLIKRSIRDLYTRDIDEVLVEGEEGYKTAKAFMRTLMPSHAKRVQPHRDPLIGLFHQHQIESQIDAIHSPVAQLRSGGYLVINQTEALVAIDVNSGRSTRERNIEETALRTNLEAADEIGRQVRLRGVGVNTGSFFLLVRSGIPSRLNFCSTSGGSCGFSVGAVPTSSFQYICAEFSGSFGYGLGHEFDHKTCPQALEDFKALQAKYLGG
jgi:ribonuclease E